jgi:hypothetical protein
MFGGASTPKVDPIPTRDTAAASVEADTRRRAQVQGMLSTMLTGPGGVPSGQTAVRSAGP